MGLLNTVTKDRKIYGNCQVLSPEGHLMFRCESKKANWYLKRDLAQIVNLDPLTIKLNFEPNGLGNHNKGYGLSEMANLCVVCGSEEFLTRHHVVPICYRKYFTLEKKSHNFHDVLSVCADCHEKYEESAFQYKNELAKIYDAPINGELIDNSELFRIRKIVRCLLSSGVGKIPISKIQSMKKELRSYYSWKKVTKKRLQSILNISVRVYNRTHGEIVVSSIQDLDTFIKDWRKHFINNNDCKYLPQYWSIDNE
jgi:hypothetical protein